MSSIPSNVQSIRNAVYGEEVREAIASSIEQMNTVATNAAGTVSNFSNRIQDAENGIDSANDRIDDTNDRIDTSDNKITKIIDIITYNNLAFPIEEWVNGYCLQNAGSEITDPAARANFRYCKVPCNPGDYFVINAGDDNWSAYRTWGFIKANGTIINYADKGMDANNVIIVAPAEASYMICNDYSSSGTWTKVSYKNLFIGDQLKKFFNTQCAYVPFHGLAFIAHCGDSLVVDCESFRVYNKFEGIYSASDSKTTYLPLTTETIRYVDYDGVNFVISYTMTSNTIAHVYGRHVYPYLNNIIPDYRKIQNGYLRNGSEYYLNFARTPIDGYLDYYSPDIKISNKGYIIKEAGTKNYQIGDTYATFTLTNNDVNLENKKILFIGDSFISRGYIQNYLRSLVPTMTFIGTKTTQNYGILCEGVSGSRLYYFTSPDTSPFYFNGSLNFGNYISSNNLQVPDYVVINSAINHTSYNDSEHGSYKSNLVSLVSMIKNYNSNIKIYVTYGANYAITCGSDYGYANMRYPNVRQCCNSVYDIDDITVIPIDTALIDELDYPKKTVEYFDTNVEILSDCVHPSENIGFKKIANMIYNYLGQ